MPTGLDNRTFFVDFSREITEKVLKEQKRLKTAEKVVRPAFGCAQHPKAGQNTQQLWFDLDEYVYHTQTQCGNVEIIYFTIHLISSFIPSLVISSFSHVANISVTFW